MSLFNQIIATTLPFIPKPIVGYFAAPYIAGETLDDAVRVTRKLNEEGACATIDILGENITREEAATSYADQYLRVLDTIAAEKLDSNVSFKPTQMGLKLDREFCLETVKRIADKAKEIDNFLRIDMEDISCTDDTLWLFQQLKDEYPVGTVLQAYLRRTDKDLDTLLPMKTNLRLCKGIYIEPYSAAYKDKEIVRRNFLHLLERILESDSYIGIATHDEFLVWGALRLLKKLDVPRKRYEFQMLLGVQPQLRKVILEGGHKLRVYVPFGRHWHAYSVRRLKENPEIAGYVMHSILKGNFGKH
jgi:proline dehydrogenase